MAKSYCAAVLLVVQTGVLVQSHPEERGLKRPALTPTLSPRERRPLPYGRGSVFTSLFVAQGFDGVDDGGFEGGD